MDLINSEEDDLIHMPVVDKLNHTFIQMNQVCNINRTSPFYKNSSSDKTFVCDRNLDQSQIKNDIIQHMEISNLTKYLTKVSHNFYL